MRRQSWIFWVGPKSREKVQESGTQTGQEEVLQPGRERGYQQPQGQDPFRGAPRGRVALPAPWFQTFGFQNGEQINVCCC